MVGRGVAGLYARYAAGFAAVAYAGGFAAEARRSVAIGGVRP